MRISENQLKRVIRKTILEVTNMTCNYISLGFIDMEGNFHDIEDYRQKNPEKTHVIDHDSYLYELYGNKYSYSYPRGWLKITNARFVQYTEPHFWSVSSKQIDGIIDMLTKCKKHCLWISRDIEGTDVEFYGSEDLPPHYYYNMSWPAFIQKHGDGDQLERLLDMSADKL